MISRLEHDLVQRSKCCIVVSGKIGTIETAFRNCQQICVDQAEMDLICLTNKGLERITTSTVVVNDADRVAEKGFYKHAASLLQQQTNMAVATKRIYKTAWMLSDSQILNKKIGSVSVDERNKTGSPLEKNVFSGHFVINTDVLRACLSNVSHTGYGWEDQQLNHELTLLGGKSHLTEDFREVHLYHEPFTYGSKDPSVLYKNNMLKYYRKIRQPPPLRVVDEFADKTMRSIIG